VGLGDDRGLLAEHRVAAYVVAVPMGVEHELQVARADLAEREADLVGQRCELVVDDEDPVGSHGGADVAAGPLQHVDVAGDLGRLDLHLRKVPILRRRRAGGQRQQQERALYPELAHLKSPSCGSSFYSAWDSTMEPSPPAPSPASGRGVKSPPPSREFWSLSLLCSPRPLAGEGPGVRAS